MITLTAKDLNRALRLCKPAISRRSSLPILQNVLIEATGTEATLRATDLETMICVRIPAQGEFTACVEHRHLVDLDMSGEVTMEYIDDGNLVIESDAMSAELRTLPVDEFPQAIAFNKRVRNFSREDIGHLAALAPFTSADESRAILTGIGISENRIAAATDTHRLGVAELSARGLPDMIIPGKAIRTLGYLLPKDCETVKMQWSTFKKSRSVSNIRFTCGDVEFTCRNIEGQFPNWRRVVPTDFWNNTSDKAGIRFDRGELIKVCSQLSGPARKHSGRLVFQFRDGEAFVTTGSCHDICVMRRLPCQYPDDTLPQAFNAVYMLGIAQFVGGGEIVLRQIGSDTSPVHASNGVRAAVLMPMQPEDVLEMPRVGMRNVEQREAESVR